LSWQAVTAFQVGSAFSQGVVLMSDLDFTWNGYRCFRADKAAEDWHYIPLAADVERNADGLLAISMHEMNATVYVMLAASWGAGQADLDMLRERIASMLTNIQTRELRLAFAPLSQSICNLLVGDGSGHFDVAATRGTSGFPPYTALFNLAWQDDLAQKLKAGLAGTSGHLGIEYEALLERPASAAARLETTARDLLAFQTVADTSDEMMADYLERAIRTGQAVFTISSGTLLDTVQSRALLVRCAEKCLALLGQWSVHGATGTLVVETKLNDMIMEPVRAFCDIGTLIANTSSTMRAGGSHASN
jgi:hypothetical protein